jgi:hypothetical protein
VGIAANWISVAGLSKAEVLARMGLEETGEVISLASRWFDGDAIAGVAELPRGRVLVLSDDFLFPPESAAKVSAGCELIWVERVDTVSFIKTAGFRDGQQLWSVERNPDLPELFKATGELPLEVHSAVAARGEGDDYDLALSIPGQIGRYDPEEDLDGFDCYVRVLQKIGAPVRRRKSKTETKPPWDYQLRSRAPMLSPVLAVSSFAMFFVWGSHFDLFGKDIDLRHHFWINVGQDGWMAAAFFFVGFWLGGIRGGLYLGGGVAGLFVIATLIGMLFGSYG